jgi:hypothetical protein
VKRTLVEQGRGMEQGVGLCIGVSFWGFCILFLNLAFAFLDNVQ